MAQKLSASPRRWIRSRGTPTSLAQISIDSSSVSNTVTQMRSGSSSKTVVASSQAGGMACDLK
jgi:hypothetical protein